MHEQTKQTVLDVLRGQSPDYLIAPFAAAFAAEGLQPDDVQAALDELADEGLARIDQVVATGYITTPEGEPLLDADGNPVIGPLKDVDGNDVIVSEGWTITDEGRAA